MAKVLVVYYSRGGNTRQMAELIGAGAREAGAEVEVRSVSETAPADLAAFDALIVGSPTYYGGPAAEIKKLLDESVRLHGKLAGKVGGAFASSATIAGGNETTVLALLQALLIHGMVVQGDPAGSHYGPVAVNAPDRRAADECHAWGRRLAALAAKLAG